MSADEVPKWLAKEARRLGSQKELAKAIGVTPAFVCDIINGRREPSGKPLAYLGLVRRVIYVRSAHD
jgi:transcriptional regulator with XRE-family HTH domain